MNETLFGNKGKQRFKPKDFIEWSRVHCVANKRTKPKNAEIKGAAMILAGCTLYHMSGMCESCRPTTDCINIRNSVRRSDFKKWEDNNLEEAIGKMKTTSLAKKRDMFF